MNVDELLSSITPQAYENLKRAIELGKWANDEILSRKQRENCIQAVIAYELKYLPAEERSGYIPPKTGGSCSGDKDTETPLKWQ